MQPLVPHRILLATVAVALATACDEPPPVGGGQDRLFAAAADARVLQGRSTKLTVTSLTAAGTPGEGSATATIAPAGVATIAAEDDPATEQTASAALVDGIGIFDLLCTTNPAQTEDAVATISVTGPTGTATATVTCAPQVEQREITVDRTDCDRFLQADGASSCVVEVTVRSTGVNTPVPDAVLDVTVDTATLAGGGDGNRAVLKKVAADVAAATITGLTTDAQGRTTFIVVSPVFGVEQAMQLTLKDDAGNDKAEQIAIGPFLDKSQVSLTTAAADLASGDSATVTVSALDLNGSAAAGKTVQVTVGDGLTATAGGCLAADGAAALDATGACVFTVVGDDPGNATREVLVQAAFRAAPQGLERTANLTMRVNPQGVTIATAEASPLAILADAEPSASTLTVTARKDGAGLAGSVVTVTVSSESRGVIKLAGVANEDVASVTVAANGVATFTIVPDNLLSRGNGRLTVSVVDPDGVAFDVPSAPQNITITVDRAPLLSSLVFDGFQPDSIIGVPGGPRPSSTGVQFKLLDEQNAPVANVPVRFIAQSSVPGVTIVPFDTSDAGGLVRTVVTAGRVAGPITIVAVVESPALSAVSPAISVVGGLPNSAYSTISCDTIASQNTSTDCTVTLADKFTNVVDTALNVQFRAEGGSIVATAEASGGTATTTFSAGAPGPGSADVTAWTYSALRTPPAAVVAAFPGCFDKTTRTRCDLFALCSPAANDPNRALFEAFCPLPPSASGAGSCVADISATARQALIDEGNNPEEWEVELFTDINALANVDVDAQFRAYVTEQRLCGFTLGCLVGDADGLGLDPSDDCPVNPGCLDYSTATECPQSGLLDVLAALRGEEGYDDQNGNGVRDANEDFVDFPEPFLDKNSSCSFDSLNDNPRLTASQKIQLSDLFIDSDPADGQFGFVSSGVRTETNGIFDSDTELTLKTSVVQLGAGRLQLGAVVSATACGLDGAADVDCPAASANEGTSTCTEVATGGNALLEGCSPSSALFTDGTTVTLGFRWTDENGNCPSENFAGTPDVEADGPVVLSFDRSPLSPGVCGAVPGASQNPERPWCEEHPQMGSPTRTFSLTADCGDETGLQPVKVTFTLDDLEVTRTFQVSCPPPPPPPPAP